MITPSVTYYDGISRNRNGFLYATEFHTWFSRNLGGFLGVAYDDPKNQPQVTPSVIPVSVSGGISTSTVLTGNEPTSGQLLVLNPGDRSASWRYTFGARYRF